MLDLAGRQRACIGDWQIRLLGASATELTRLHSSPRWFELERGVLGIVGVESDAAMRASAGVLAAGPGAVLTHSSGAAWWGLRGYALLPACVSQRDGRAHRRQQPGPLHQLVTIPPRWVTTLNGIAVVRPELVAYQLCGLVRPERAERAFDALWSMRLLSIRSSTACLRDLEERGRNGTVVYRALLEARSDRDSAPGSGLESRVQQIARDAGVTMRRQIDSGGELWSGRVDFRDQELPFVLEVMSEAYHRALSYQRDDEVRREKLEADGFVVKEIWDTDVWTRPDLVVRIIESGRRAARLVR